MDPVGIVWRYEDPGDREIVALIASCLAYGQVAVLRRAIEEILEILGPHPRAALANLDPAEAFSEPLEPFVYRMTRGEDVLDLLCALSEMLRRYGSLERAYRARDDDETDAPTRERDGGDSEAGRAARIDDHLRSASRFVGRLRRARLRDELHRGFRYLLPDPADGAACKRLHLFFRWMVRGPDGIDLGLWEQPRPDALLMPLDTHTARICRYIGLVERKSVDGKAARLVADALAELDPHDPLRYDFPICHLGISRGCIHRRSEEHCPQCPLDTICTLQ